MGGDPKIIGSGSDGREYDPLLTPEQVAKRLEHITGLGLGPFLKKDASSARHPFWRGPRASRNAPL